MSEENVLSQMQIEMLRTYKPDTYAIAWRHTDDLDDLMARGFIEWVPGGYGPNNYAITEAGRAAIADTHPA